ncbi:MAG: AP-3 complex subunit delta [Cirrosporium novae-zelandiae]|nr:MAG: AP-3 complex subunit delta [Cirrosporium novae-zelandiae]
MFGHDMSWASFNVLEVMSSAKYLQKRVGYLGAVQSFRPDTEVLMLATNLLKKDVTSSLPLVMALPLGALPHISTPSLALSLVSDLLPRLSHSQAVIRKKTVATLFRMALVYPETLRPAWPKIKDRLMDVDEDPSVTAAVVNVVCELGWRRPQDFLSLAPRLFDLLVGGSNNWMAIKIIKLFATLTPLEPRLIRKLLPPLTNLIRTTTAMSLLYECINGIIQGGILEASDSGREGDEIASLCAEKLRGMIVVEGDPNLKYVALLALNKIVLTRPFLVSTQQDVIMDCLDDSDISIRIQALDLVIGMVNSDNLQPVVERLITQLRLSPTVSAIDDPMNDRGPRPLEPSADSEEEDPEESLRISGRNIDERPALPDSYRLDVISKILDICSRDMYTNVTDFEWYIKTLVDLVRLVPAPSALESIEGLPVNPLADEVIPPKDDVSSNIGSELLNVAVRVKSLRSEATRAAEALVLVDNRPNLFPPTGNGGQNVLKSAVWIVGEYAEYLLNPQGVLSSLLHPSTMQLPAEILIFCIQAAPKIFSRIVHMNASPWSPERETMLNLTLKRLITFLETLSTHPNLEVQERSIGFLEYMRLAAESLSSEGRTGNEPPLLLTSVLPSLFSGLELNPVAPGAQRKVPIPEGLNLDAPIHSDLAGLLQTSEFDTEFSSGREDFDDFYYKPPPSAPTYAEDTPAAERLRIPDSYQSQTSPITSSEAAELIERRRAERRERNKDDPFFLGKEDADSTPSTYHNILSSGNGDVDIDSIPIMALDLGPSRQEGMARPIRKKARKKVDITFDETLPDSGASSAQHSGTATPSHPATHKSKTKRPKALLQVDSSALGGISLSETASGPGAYDELEMERKKKEEEEMKEAMKEVERLRLEMQRANERVQKVGTPEGGEVIRRKKKKIKGKNKATEPARDEVAGPAEPSPEGDVVVKKKKKRKVISKAAETMERGEVLQREARGP